MFNFIKKYVKSITEIRENHSENLLKKASYIYEEMLEDERSLSKEIHVIQEEKEEFENEKERWEDRKEHFEDMRELELKRLEVNLREKIRSEYMTESAMDIEIDKTRIENKSLVQTIENLRDKIDTLKAEKERIIGHNNILMDKIVHISELAIKESSIKNIDVKNQNDNNNS